MLFAAALRIGHNIVLVSLSIRTAFGHFVTDVLFVSFCYWLLQSSYSQLYKYTHMCPDFLNAMAKKN